VTDRKEMRSSILRRGIVLCLVSVAAAVTADTVPAADKVELDSVSVHLFLEDSGTLSRDIATVTDFSSWNGSSDEGRADAILIMVRFRSSGEAFAKGEQARVLVTTQKSRFVVTSQAENRVIKSERLKDIYIGPQGTTYRAVFVPGVGCTPLKITVTGGSKVFTKKLDFACGE
jgi:hypothetical protein